MFLKRARSSAWPEQLAFNQLVVGSNCHPFLSLKKKEKSGVTKERKFTLCLFNVFFFGATPGTFFLS